MSEPRLFLDCDGVLADFDAGVEKLLGMSPAAYQEKHSARDFWFRLRRAKDFYATLPEMPDARILFDAVAALHPTILTGLPIGNWAAPQKQAWVDAHFPGTPLITTMARDKHKHMKAGDVLVDDRDTHCAAYEAHGVRFILHRSAKESLAALAKIYPSLKV